MTPVQAKLGRVGVGIALALVAVLGAASSAAGDTGEGGPLLTVEVTTEVSTVSVGSSVDYSVAVTNAGADAEGLVVRVEVPIGSTIEKSSAGEPDGNTLSTTIDVASGDVEEVTVVVTPGESAAAEESMSVIASVFADDDAAAPLVRTASVLPVAKVTDAASAGIPVIPLVIGAAVVLAAVVAMVVVVVRRRSRRAFDARSAAQASSPNPSEDEVVSTRES